MRPHAPEPLNRAAPRSALELLTVIHDPFYVSELAAQAPASTFSPPEGEKLAVLASQWLQTRLQPLPRPCAAFGGNFTSDAGKTREALGSWFHR